ncbi:PEP-utilizing enzyme [Mesorhizobium sp. B2-6-4]|uniref:PEP-utilizing enzyme n=1 Tax=Mesorhizobium sp. B2-6-4 TaxID=2589913 RepID=UPI001AEDA356|nr:PEP-utilizing enzyme [Mesorhizobium sp. B2-6-4]
MCFQVHGDHITEISRTRVIEGRFDHGYRILYEGLHGISADQVLSILRGDSKLEGINDLDLIEDNDTEWKAKLEYHFAGVWVTSAGRHLRPYAIVTSWGPDDMKHAARITPDSDSVKTSSLMQPIGQEMSGRNLYYADDPDRDVVKSLRFKSNDPDIATAKDGTVSILFKEIRGFPMTLMSAHHDPQKALDAFINADRNLERRGYCDLYPREYFKVRYECEKVTDPAPDAQTHMTINENSQTDFNTIGRFRNKVIDAKQRGMELEEYEHYQSIMLNRDSPFQQRLDALDNVMKLQKTLDRSIPDWREAIIEQAGLSWIEMEFNGKTIRFPRAPFENWCLWRTDGAHLAPPWQIVSPQGVKMMGDDPYHTDFLIGAGLEPDAMMRDRMFNDAVFKLRGEVQQEKMGFECAVLSGKGSAWGTVVHPKVGDSLPDDAIVVLKSASAKYLDLALQAKGVIVERGGEMAHLITVAREKDAIIVRVPDALKIYPADASVTIDASEGKVTLHEGDMKSIWEFSRRQAE